MFTLIFLILASLIGNLYRLPILNGGITMLDLAVAMTVFCGISHFFLRKEWRKETFKSIISSNKGFWYIWAIFLLITAISTGWGIALWGIDFGSIAYFARLLIYFIFLPIVHLWLSRDIDSRIKQIIFAVLATAFGLSLLGFLQLWIFPDFTAMEALGWDPHQNSGVLITVFLTTLTALFFTFSRSAWLSFAIGAGIVMLFRSWKTLLLSIIIVLIAISFSSRAQERIIGAISLDKSASFRIESWQNAIKLWEKSPWFGVGYNYLRVAQTKEGMVASEDVHSAGGSDSTWLTVLATTGILGVICWSILFLEILALSWKQFKKHKNILGLGLFAGSTALFIDSWFVNSLLFPFILIYWFGIAGIILISTRKRPH
ncbi:MAG: O-antigen ligase family protein [Patescibacteria group bacterium]|nr:O-antigen ligase family protein [Patescibacteria group bacterium]